MNFLNKAIEMYSRKSYCIFRALYYFLSLVSTQFKVQSVLSMDLAEYLDLTKKLKPENINLTSQAIFSSLH